MANTHYDYLVIGAGIAGVTAAETIRESQGDVSIGILAKEPHYLYSRVLLPAYLKKRIPRERLFLRAADAFEKQKIALHLEEEAAQIDCAARQVAASSGKTFGFGKLLIAAGGRVNQWNQGWNSELVHPHTRAGVGVYRLQTLDDADRLFTALPSIRRPLIVGSSFIALEFIEIFLQNGIVPAVITPDPWFFGKMLDKEGAALLADNFARYGVRIYADETIREVAAEEGALLIRTAHSGSIRTDALAIGIGIRRNTEFLNGSGIAADERGIKVDEFLETDVTGVFAAGDVAIFYDRISGQERTLGNWTNAVLQGRRAGLNMAGESAPFLAVSSYAISNLGFQITALGECDNGAEAITGIDGESGRYGRFFIRDGVLIGAFLINRFADKPHLAQLIAGRTQIEPYRGRLRDPAFDISSIPAVH